MRSQDHFINKLQVWWSVTKSLRTQTESDFNYLPSFKNQKSICLRDYRQTQFITRPDSTTPLFGINRPKLIPQPRFGEQTPLDREQ